MSAADIGLLLFFAAAFAYDGLARLNAWADRAEDWVAKLPGMAWFHWRHSGDPATWFQHALWAVLIGVIDGGFTAGLGGSFGLGILHGVRIAVVMYISREAYQAWQHYREHGWTGAVSGDWPRVGWLLDGIGDVAGPMVTLAVTRIILA